MKDFISVIIPIHNSAKYLDKCVQSILNQSYVKLEILCILNGCTDNSLDIVSKYKDRVIIKVLEEASISKARNLGIKESTGEYIAFIDSDDTIEFTYFEELYKSIIYEKSDLSICDICEVYENIDRVIYDNDYPKNTINKRAILENLDKFRLGPVYKLYKSSIIKDNKILFPELKYEDIYFVLSYILKCNSISKVNKNLYNYIIHSNSEQTTVDMRLFDIFDVIKLCDSLTSEKSYLNIKVNLLCTYSLKTRYMKDNKLRNEFIERAYFELNNIEFKKSKYIKKCSFIKKIILKHKNLVKIYTFLYSKVH